MEERKCGGGKKEKNIKKIYVKSSEYSNVFLLFNSTLLKEKNSALKLLWVLLEIFVQQLNQRHDQNKCVTINDDIKTIYVHINKEKCVSWLCLSWLIDFTRVTWIICFFFVCCHSLFLNKCPRPKHEFSFCAKNQGGCEGNYTKHIFSFFFANLFKQFNRATQKKKEKRKTLKPTSVWISNKPENLWKKKFCKKNRMIR